MCAIHKTLIDVLRGCACGYTLLHVALMLLIVLAHRSPALAPQSLVGRTHPDSGRFRPRVRVGQQHGSGDVVRPPRAGLHLLRRLGAELRGDDRLLERGQQRRAEARGPLEGASGGDERVKHGPIALGRAAARLEFFNREREGLGGCRGGRLAAALVGTSRRGEGQEEDAVEHAAGATHGLRDGVGEGFERVSDRVQGISLDVGDGGLRTLAKRQTAVAITYLEIPLRKRWLRALKRRRTAEENRLNLFSGFREMNRALVLLLLVFQIGDRNELLRARSDARAAAAWPARGARAGVEALEHALLREGCAGELQQGHGEASHVHGGHQRTGHHTTHRHSLRFESVDDVLRGNRHLHRNGAPEVVDHQGNGIPTAKRHVLAVLRVVDNDPAHVLDQLPDGLAGDRRVPGLAVDAEAHLHLPLLDTR
mmetsp:Transcript_21879/g.42492  ORF Transcript_21879/g.42492 Transcript_21879/m.42492 type:complete len:424 (-) Transcript_21879:824-2095(-)